MRPKKNLLGHAPDGYSDVLRGCFTTSRVSMLFNSHVFLFCFLPLTLLGFFLLGGRGWQRPAALWLTAASLFFYGWWNPRYLALIVGSILGNYAFGLAIAQCLPMSRRAKTLLTLGIGANLGLLGYYKYAAFLLGTLGQLLHTDISIGQIALPLAISFFTFTQIAYLVDAYHGRTREHDLLHYALFASFFPHLIAGPIVLYRSLMPQFARSETWRFNAANFAPAVTLFTIGLAKKVIVADSLAPAAGRVFGSASIGSVGAQPAWFGAIAYSLQLYFDFSGYSDMAIGLSRMFNVAFPLNFNSPYKAVDMIDFWRRWHITLSTFLRDHVYIPLGGNRLGFIRRYLNLFATMLLGGLWHGAGWTFLIWGALHGLYLIINHVWVHVAGGHAWSSSRPVRLAGRLLTLLAIIVGWVFFRARSVSDAIALLGGMVGQHGIGTLQSFKGQELVMLLIASAIALCAPNSQALLALALPAKDSVPTPRPLWQLTPISAIAAGSLFVASVLHLSRVSEFLYFRF